MKRISKVLLLALMVCTLFAGCSIETIQSKKEDSKYNFYYLNTNETALKSEPYEPKEETKEYLADNSIDELAYIIGVIEALALTKGSNLDEV